MENNNIEIVYQNIPTEILNDFSSNSRLSVKISEYPSDVHHFDGGPPDLVITLGRILYEGYIYDAFKTSLIYTWSILRTYYFNKGIPVYHGKNGIELSFKAGNDRTIEFFLKGDVSEEQIKNITEKLFEYLKDSKTINSDFNNPKYKDSTYSKPRIRMRYNSEKGKWEPTSYKSVEDLFKEYYEKAQNKYLS